MNALLIAADALARKYAREMALIDDLVEEARQTRAQERELREMAEAEAEAKRASEFIGDNVSVLPEKRRRTSA